MPSKGGVGCILSAESFALYYAKMHRAISYKKRELSLEGNGLAVKVLVPQA